MTLIIKNADENMTRAIKNVIKLDKKTKLEISKAKSWKEESDQLIKDYKEGKIKAYDNVEDMFKSMGL